MIFAKIRKEIRGGVTGEEYQVRSLLNGNDSAQVLFDRERELGTFLTEYQAQMDKDWNEGAIYPLVQASKNILERKKLEAAAGKYLEEKLNTDDPIGYYAAYQCYSWYLDGKGKGADWFEERAMCLTKSFKQELWADKRYYLILAAVTNKKVLPNGGVQAVDNPIFDFFILRLLTISCHIIPPFDSFSCGYSSKIPNYSLEVEAHLRVTNERKNKIRTIYTSDMAFPNSSCNP